MKILSVRYTEGPNIYIYKPVMVARVDLEQYTERESYEFEGFSDRLLLLLPGLREHHCAKGVPGGFVDRLYGGTYFGHITEHVCIELACLAGLNVHFGKTWYAGSAGHYDIIMECLEFSCQSRLLYFAATIVDSLVHGQVIDISQEIDDVKKLYAKRQLGPSTLSIVEAAQSRNIPVRRMSSGSLIQLGYGHKRKLVEATVTDNTSAVSVDIACDKDMTKHLLKDAGIPVPEGVVVDNVEEAIAHFINLDGPVVVKPYNGNQGRGVSLNLVSAEEVETSFQIAQQFSSEVIVERFIQGVNVRCLVIGGQFVAASERIAAHVCGDGQSTIEQLIDEVNSDEKRGFGHERPLTKIAVDAVVRQTLRKNGMDLTHIPSTGNCILLRESANLSTGGEAIDVTEKLHKSYRQIAERTARIIGLDICGIDMVIPSVTQPGSGQNCAVIEVNAAPGIRMHQYPSHGAPRPVGKAIVDSLFPYGDNGRIPIVSITGTNGKTTTTRLVGHAFSQMGKVVGMTTTGGVYLNGQKIISGDTTGPVSARAVLTDSSVEVAVLETARGGIVRGGLAYDKANVAVITNISLDHVGQDGIETLDDLVHIKSLVAECVVEDGTVVLNVEDENLVQISKRLTSRVVFFGPSESHAEMRKHLACGGVGYYVSQGWLIEAKGNLSWEIVALNDIPLTHRGMATFQVENVLAAAAALRASGLTRQQVARAFQTFTARENYGRAAIYQLPTGAHLLLDYGHNPDGFVKVGNWLKGIPHKRLVGVIGVPGDRADVVVKQSALCLAELFDAFIVKEDEDRRGRPIGEIAELLKSEILAKSPHKPCLTLQSEAAAIEHAVKMSEVGDIIAVFYEELFIAEQTIRELGGLQVESFESQIKENVFAVQM